MIPFGAMCDHSFTATGIQRALETAYIGRPTYHHASIGSTMDEARRLTQGGAPEGTAVVADEQTAGRGRLQRTWWAPAGSSLLLSLLYRPTLLPSQAQRLTMICSLAVCDAIDLITGVQARIKWPNDVLVAERKVCGILTELDVLGTDLNYAIVGMGINVNVDLQDAPPFMAPATSLWMETGHTVSRLDLLVCLFANIERRYTALRQGRSFDQEWARRMATLGRHVQATSGSERCTGLATGVDQDGALLLRLEDGSVRRVLAGDVTLRSLEHSAEDAPRSGRTSTSP